MLGRRRGEGRRRRRRRKRGRTEGEKWWMWVEAGRDAAVSGSEALSRCLGRYRFRNDHHTHTCADAYGPAQTN
jgi:hypothetical protein